MSNIHLRQPGSTAQSVARLTAIPGLASSNSSSANCRLIVKSFHFSLPLIQEGQLSVDDKSVQVCAQMLVSRLED